MSSCALGQSQGDPASRTEGPVSSRLFLHLCLAHGAVSTIYKQKQDRVLLKNVPTSTKIKSKCARANPFSFPELIIVKIVECVFPGIFSYAVTFINMQVW